MLIFSTVLPQNVSFLKNKFRCVFFTANVIVQKLLARTHESQGGSRGAFQSRTHQYWVHISTRSCCFFSLSCNRHVDIPLNSLHFCSNAFARVSPISLLAKITNTFYEKVKWKRKNISHIWPVFGTYNCISRQRGLENSPTRQQECDNASKSAKAGNRQLGFTLQMPLTHIPEITRTIMVFIV